MNLDPAPFWLTLRLASVTTLVLLILGLPLAYWLAATRSPVRRLVEPLVSLPLVLPPTVLGFYILVGFGAASPVGSFLSAHGLSVVFSFSGLVLGSVIFSLPFMVNPLKSALIGFPRPLIEAAQTLGKPPLTVFTRVILPNLVPSIVTAAVMTFAHTVGEFGVVLMVGGNIPGATRTASIAVFSELEALNYGTANLYAGILLAASFLALFAAQFVRKPAYDRVAK